MSFVQTVSAHPPDLVSNEKFDVSTKRFLVTCSWRPAVLGEHLVSQIRSGVFMGRSLFEPVRSTI